MIKGREVHPIVSRLREIRIQENKTQEDVSRELGLYGNHIISDWETGRKTPVLNNFLRWASALGYVVELTRKP